MADFTLNTTPIALPFQNAVARLELVAFAEALWARRLDIWSLDPEVRQRIANRLGWLNAPEFVTPQLPRVRAFAERIKEEGFTDIVLLGMGGSSLAPEVLRRILGTAPGWPRFRVLDSVDPEAVHDAMANAATTLFVMASKSGSTIEPNTMAAEAQRRVRAAGIPHWGPRFVAITDEGTPFHQRAQAEGFREIFVNPSDIGGRFSALSFFGIVPAALMGIDLDALLGPAIRMADACRTPDPAANPGLALGAYMAAAAQAGRDKLTLVFPPELASLGLWIEQLVAESTGKQNKGVVPIADEPEDAPLGADRAAVAVHLGSHEPPRLDRVNAAGAPLLGIVMPGAMALGAEFLRWEVATAAAGLLLDINPFDEPNVQQAKDATRTLLDVYAAQKRLPVPEPHAALDHARLTLSTAALESLNGADATHLLTLARQGDYIGLLAYLPPEDGLLAAALVRARAAIGRRTCCATMFGYGPRYLHSTGQLHKGGANNGVFIIVTAAPAQDLAIPGEPFSFGVLEMAQAIGDFQSLDRTGRRALHIHLPDRDAQRLERVLLTLADRTGPRSC